MLLPDHINTFHAAFDEIRNDVQSLHEAFGNLKVHFIIINHKNVCALASHDASINDLGSFLAHSLAVLTYRSTVNYLLSKSEIELRALSVFAFHIEAAVHHGQQTFNYRHTKAGSFDILILSLIKSLERDKELVEILFLDTDTGILDLNIECTVVRSHILSLYGHSD